MVAGGVSANYLLRERLQQMAHKENIQVYYPRLEFCTDNGAMIAYAGYRRYVLGDRGGDEIKVYSTATAPTEFNCFRSDNGLKK